MYGYLSDERTGLSFTSAAGPPQRSHSRVRVPWDSWSYFTVSDSRLPFSSPPTTRRATVEVFDPASTQLPICPAYNISAWTAEKTLFLIVVVQLLPWEHFYLRRRYSATAVVYSGTSNFEHSPFQETVRLSSCSTFELNLPIWNNVNWINPFPDPKIYPV
jgi:hypothetical protein